MSNYGSGTMVHCTGNPACSKECLAAGRHVHPFPDWMHPLDAAAIDKLIADSADPAVSELAVSKALRWLGELRTKG